MIHREPLSNWSVGISISQSPEMAVLGLGAEHLDDAMTEIARHLLAKGAHLRYGGDLRPGGFTELLFELVARYRRDTAPGEPSIGVSNYLAWPSHISLPAEQITELADYLDGMAELTCLGSDGRVISLDERKALQSRPPSASEWTDGLTAMRQVMSKACDARIVVGGRVAGYKGRMPGVAEESLLALHSQKPLFVLGGFGGCACEIAELLGLMPAAKRVRHDWPGKRIFLQSGAASLNNGLSDEENHILARTVHIDQAVALILRGLMNQSDRANTRPHR